MKTYFTCSKKHPNVNSKSLFFVLLVLTLVGCSGGMENKELSQLREENEKLRIELNAANANLEAAELRVEELEAKLTVEEKKMATTRENEVVQSEQIPVQMDIVPPQLEPTELLLGEWFYQNFHKEGGKLWTQSMVFNGDGTGTIIKTYYLPNDTLDFSSSDPNYTGEFSDDFSWSLDGDTLRIEIATGEIGEFIFSSAQQQIRLKTGSKQTQVYAREKPSGLENYIEVSVFLNKKQAKEAALIRRFLGSWYYDVFIWTFNGDGTGDIDIPELGDQPATKRKFSYSASGDDAKTMIIIEWEDSEISFYWPTIDESGAMILQGASGTEPIKLTRIFDIDNCPISEAIIANGIGVLSGSIFSDILPS